MITPLNAYFYARAVFGWFQNSFIGIERESPYNLSVGYLKGAEQAGVRLMLNVMKNLGTARKHPHSTLQQNLCMGIATWIFEQSLTLNDDRLIIVA